MSRRRLWAGRGRCACLVLAAIALVASESLGVTRLGHGALWLVRSFRHVKLLTFLVVILLAAYLWLLLARDVMNSQEFFVRYARCNYAIVARSDRYQISLFQRFLYSIILSPAAISRSIQLSKKTLVLDLDETLISSTARFPESYDTIIRIRRDDEFLAFYVRFRPHVHEFLALARHWYHIVIFTASQRAYAEPIIKFLDVNNVISRTYFKENCTRLEDNSSTKNLLTVLADLRKVILIDNDQRNFRLQPNNGILISSWMGDPGDNALRSLLPLLQSLTLVPDVREIIEPS